MGVWFEIWTRPGDSNFRRIFDDIPFRDAAFDDAMGELGSGSLTVPDTFVGFDQILKVAGADSASSLVRVRNAVGDIVFEWLPNQIVPTEGKGDPYVDISGASIKEILKYAVTMPFDWDGTDYQVPASPNWQWGADNILGLPGFEEPQATAKTIELVIVATGGTYTLTDGTDNTAPIAWDAGAAVIEAAIEADLGLLPDVVVAGTEANPIRRLIQLVAPPFGVNLGIDDSGLTGPDNEGTTQTTIEGGWNFNPWTPAHALVSGAPTTGFYDDIGISDNFAHTGTYSMRVNPGAVGQTSNRGGGIQQVVSVVPGGLYQVGVWIRTTATDDRWRLGLFTVGEEIIAMSNPVGQTFTPNTWNLVTFQNLTIPSGVDQVIFRVQNTNGYPYNASPAYIDDAFMYPGMPVTTIGDILGLLYVGWVGQMQRNPIVWEDGGNPTWPYLTFDFDAVNDSSGAPWDESEVSMEVWLRMTPWDVLKDMESRYGIEWRVVPDDPEAGTWLLQVYNSGNMDDHPDVAIMGGSFDTRRQIRRYRPSTVYVVEGGNRSVGIATDPVLLPDFGRIEVARLDKEAMPHEDSVMAAVQQDVIDGLINGVIWSYEQTDPDDEVGTAYRLGDSVVIHDPPEVNDVGRTWSYSATVSPDGTLWDVDYIAPEDEESPGDE